MRIHVGIELSEGKSNLTFYKKFYLNIKTKKYTLEYDDWPKDKREVISIEVCTWIRLRVKGIIDEYNSETPQTFFYPIPLYIAEKIGSMKNIRFTYYRFLSPHEYVFSDENNPNDLLSVAQGIDGYSVSIKKIMQPRRYI